MSELEEKLESILNNPEAMQQIMSMAQSFSQAQPSEKGNADPPQTPIFDPGMLQKLSGLAGQTGIDRQEQALLQALRPYVNHQRVEKLERAMRAAKMAKFASGFLNAGGIKQLSGR